MLIRTKILNQIKLTALLVVTALCMVAFQNCSSVSSQTTFSNASGGEGYSGKVLVNRLLQGTCSDGTTIESEMHLISSSKANLVKTSCALLTIPQQVQIQFSSNAPSVALYNSKRFLPLETLDQALPLPFALGAIGFAQATEGMPCDTGDCWYMNSNGYIIQKVAITTSGTHRLRIEAKAELALGLGANMDIRIDGVSVANTTVTALSPTFFEYNLNLGAGTHELSIGFTNDYIDSTQDRNLFLYRVELARP